MRLIVAANRGPIRKTENGWAPAIGGLATALLPVLEKQGGVWVAMSEGADLPERQGFPDPDPFFYIRRVPLTEEEEHAYYNGMANRVLWPVSHYMLHHLELQRTFIETYREINQRFARHILEEYEGDEYIWIQDYHLMLVPEMLREQHPDAVIAHFWHIPWPAMEVFRILPWARELIRGLLGCSLIGFHVEEYVENFLESARVLLGAEIEDNSVLWQGRRVRVEAHPIGIDVHQFQSMSESLGVRKSAEALRTEVNTEFLVVGIDRLDYTKGILSRLLAFEELLKMYEELHGRVSFVQVATPSRTDVESYKELKREVDETVGRINGQFSRSGWTPVRYHYRTYTQQELCAFYRAADVALITPLRDGMNVVTQEFIAASAGGVLVLSELTGAAYLLPEALKVNPYDREGLTQTIRRALEMPAEEKNERLTRLKTRVAALDVQKWANGFLSSMRR